MHMAATPHASVFATVSEDGDCQAGCAGFDRQQRGSFSGRFAVDIEPDTPPQTTSANVDNGVPLRGSIHHAGDESDAPCHRQ
jgi:hypothetical protein